VILDYKQIDAIMLSYGLGKHDSSGGTNYSFIKGSKHRIILERLKELDEGGARGFLYAVVLDDYKNKCSKNGHINVKDIWNESKLRRIVEQVIAHFDSIF